MRLSGCPTVYSSTEANKAPRRKQLGIKSALQTAGSQPAFAPRGEELNPEEIKTILFISFFNQS